MDIESLAHCKAECKACSRVTRRTTSIAHCQLKKRLRELKTSTYVNLFTCVEKNMLRAHFLMQFFELGRFGVE